jgi:ATP-dependent DNA helicase RecG
MRYEDRSRPALIKDLHEGVEASLELTVTKTNGYAVRNPRGYGRAQLYIFEVSGIDGPMTGREVIVWWFVSGRRAYDIVKYYTAKLERSTRFITFGRWEWEARRNTFKLRLNSAADELEILSPPTETTDDPEHTEENQPDPSLAAIHVGRRVPVYRKLGDFNSKRVREIVHAVLSLLNNKAIEETLPADLRHRSKLIGRAQAVREIHFPPPDVSMLDYEQSKSAAHVRMIFEDFFWVTFAIGFKRGQREK